MPRQPHRRGRGFTLVEILVVLAVIGILIAVLLPAIGRASGTAKATKNLANMRSLMQGVGMYLLDYGAYFPHKLPDQVVHPTWRRPGARFQWMLGDYIGAPFSPRNEEERQIMLTSNDLPRLDNQVFRDPLHDDEDYRSHQTGNLQFLRNNSYGYNYQYLGNSRPHSDGRPTRYPVREAFIKAPAVTVCFADSDGSQVMRLQHGTREHAYTLDPPTLDPERTRTTSWGHDAGQVVASIRHFGKATVAMLDGSVSMMTLEALGYEVERGDGGIVKDNAGSNALWNGLGYDPRLQAQ
ncbi:MAG: type II secretion system protein [Phycisphaeraceae bacterium]|nr:MAG: type II secretion system protein [Phycisphaeraceae bacterium]